MKKIITMKMVSIALLGFLVTVVNAQRTYFGVGLGYESLGSTSAELNKNSATYSGSQKSSLTSIGLSLTHYTSARRGYTLSVNPVTTFKSSFTSSDGSYSSTTKTSGPSFGLGLFGLIATDYLSKLEVHMCNFFTVGPLQNEFFFSSDFGLAVRYRINKKFKVALDLYPLSIYAGEQVTTVTSKNVGIKLYYAP